MDFRERLRQRSMPSTGATNNMHDQVDKHRVAGGGCLVAANFLVQMKFSS
jgi:hypothetical protein